MSRVADPSRWALKLDRPDLVRAGAYVDGTWIEDGPSFPVLDPATGETLAEVLDGDAPLARQATEAAVRAFPAWRDTPAKTRARLIRAWFDAVTRNADDMARLISSEQGKPVAEAKGEVAYGAGYLDWFSEQASRAYGETIPSPLADRRMLTVREPVGVAAVITPWNFPIAMIARKFAPALAAGCTVVGRPAEDTPLTALALMVLAEEAGIPKGVLNLVPSARENAGEVAGAWLDDARVRKLSFTGSTAVGRSLAKGSAETLKRVSLELGGDAPFIVFESADLDAAVAGLIKAKFRNAGQACTAANRVYVQASIHDAFLARLVPAVQALKVGPASDPEAQIGPLINARAFDKVSGLVRDALDKGARLAVGGGAHALGGSFFPPTVLDGVSPEMRLSCEEIFGPVAALQSFTDEADVIAMANASAYGLAAYFFSSDYAQVMRVSSRIEAGMVSVNEGIFSTEAAPFGGVKASGYGREGSNHGLDDYMAIKFVCLGGLG